LIGAFSEGGDGTQPDLAQTSLPCDSDDRFELCTERDAHRVDVGELAMTGHSDAQTYWYPPIRVACHCSAPIAGNLAKVGQFDRRVWQCVRFLSVFTGVGLTAKSDDQCEPSVSLAKERGTTVRQTGDLLPE
jgi:hypothetical protein